jgi:hypothetical protein
VDRFKVVMEIQRKGDIQEVSLFMCNENVLHRESVRAVLL